MATLKERIKAFLNPPVEGDSPESTMKARYKALCATRDEINAKLVPVQSELDKVNSEIQIKQARALELANELNAVRGGKEWIDLKKEIGMLAKALSGK